ncbi:MAG: glutathione peroxidase [Bacteroidales bacterium]|jgi:glutathione peroxidase|nr:glutathione peroxidase [Bacteroidales bacterium]MZQ80426.1 redoxin domain-containing protein [Bacteroidales bacterium]OPZ53559.1 MAG: Hydroperoxy fatty acid reductase gpx1 [Bacteroidetes bacterium ADurb.BinA012]HHV13931.1 glutathione peroxidase [Clostridiales bacterium]
MKKRLFSIAALMALILVPALSQKSFYDFTVESIDGQQYSMADLKGKKVMIVNTASQCRYTPQYKDLELLNKAYRQKLVIIGFPANNFMDQEPLNNKEIKEFCNSRYGVTFPMMAKISVKGNDMHPLYRWLTSKSANGVLDSEVSWNFQKYIIDENGNLVGFFKSAVKPLSDEVINWVTKGQFTQAR